MTGKAPSGGERIRVLHIINSVVQQTQGFFHLVTHLDADRFENRVLCLYRRARRAEELESLGIPVHALGLERRLSVGAWWTVRKAIAASDPDIVHAHLPEARWYGLTAARSLGVRARIGHARNSHRTWSKKLRLLERTVGTTATHLVAVSRAVADFYMGELGYPPGKISVVYNGLDLGPYEAAPPNASTVRADLGLPDGSIVLICVASLTRKKGHIHLLEAMATLVPAHPNVRLLLVGDGNLRDELEERARALSIEGNVSFLGRRKDVIRLLYASDIFVLPSLWEGLPLALLEAGAAGLPSVATHVDGNREIIEDGETGFLVPPSNASLLAHTLDRLLKEEPLRSEMGAKARDRIHANFDISRSISDMQRVYVESLARTAT